MATGETRTKKSTITIPPGSVTAYPNPTVAANIVPAMRTPDQTWPLSIQYCILDESGQPVFEDGVPQVEPVTIMERFQPAGKKTLSDVRGKYHDVWLYNLGHAFSALFAGANVRGRSMAIVWAKNYSNPAYSLSQLWASGKVALVRFSSSSRGFPQTLHAVDDKEDKGSYWIIPLAAVRDYCLAVATMVAVVDKYTTQETTIDAPVAEQVKAVEFSI